MKRTWNEGVGPRLTEWEVHAAREVVDRVRAEVRAELRQVLLFGSQARNEARPDSDIDLLLIFSVLPPDREPHATQAEGIAEQVASETGVPVTVWSVSLVDLEIGNRTPMLVDALTDGIPLWPPGSAAPRLELTPHDALRCASALLDRVDEGSGEVARHRRAGNPAAAARRGRDDVVRLCTAIVLLAGETRPRREEAVRRGAMLLQGAWGSGPPGRILRWAARSFGPSGQDDERPVPVPPGGFRSLAITVEALRASIVERGRALDRALRLAGTPRAGRVYQGMEGTSAIDVADWRMRN